MKKILIIQTAFLGDVVLATALLEKLHVFFPDARLDFVLRKGNENLLENHPFLHTLYVWDKKNNKYSNWFTLLYAIRAEKYDLVLNVQRYFSTGLLSVLSAGKDVRGFDKNPLSFLFDKKLPYYFAPDWHEIDRCLSLIEDITDDKRYLSRLYPSAQDYEKVLPYQDAPYICIAPCSVWHTKQLPVHKWKECIDKLDDSHTVYLLGTAQDAQTCALLVEHFEQRSIFNLAGNLTLLESAALMEKASQNYVNDSAPLHIAEAMRAPVTAVFCSTVKDFGFYPLAQNSKVLEVQGLPCRPCGVHGRKTCPKGHFNCAERINFE